MKFPILQSKSSRDSFIKMESGQSIVGFFIGDPYVFATHWVGGKSVVCQGQQCDHCKSGDYAKTRFRMNFVTKVNGQPTVKIFEQGKRVLMMIQTINDQLDLEHTVVRISRSGSGKDDTTYTIMPASDANRKPYPPLTDTAIEEAKAVGLNVLDFDAPKKDEDDLPDFVTKETVEEDPLGF